VRRGGGVMRLPKVGASGSTMPVREWRCSGDGVIMAAARRPLVPSCAPCARRVPLGAAAVPRGAARGRGGRQGGRTNDKLEWKGMKSGGEVRCQVQGNILFCVEEPSQCEHSLRSRVHVLCLLSSFMF
jgi:hypothetical protein